jgi:2-polyprenyl-3-methyl-5-hydroxy-6-metoxy-1,4-benzoquinol methylase
MTGPAGWLHPDTTSQTNERNPMTALTEAVEADRALKAKHWAIWASGSYEAVAKEIVSPLGPILVRAAGVKSSDRVLDVAAGTGNASIPAAETGAQVVAYRRAVRHHEAVRAAAPAWCATAAVVEQGGARPRAAR